MQTFKRDYAKNKTVFAAEFERKREILLQELNNKVEAKGFSAWLHRIFTRPFLEFN